MVWKSSWPWALVLLLAANLFAAAWLRFASSTPGTGGAASQAQIDLYEEAIENIQAHYVDKDRVGTEELVESSLQGMLRDLDPYSQYMSPRDHEDMRVESRGQFGGLGINIGMRDNWLTVISPIEGTPAFEAGLLPGDQIREIDGTSTEGLAVGEAVDLLRGEVDTSTTLTIISEGVEEEREVSITRRIIKLPTVAGTTMLTNGVGYVRVTQFSEPTANDLKEAIGSLKEEGMNALIMDLRGNPGGLLDSAVDISDLFLGEDRMIVYTKGRDKADNQFFRATRRTPFADLPLVLLIDNGSASASEIVAGAFQDHDRATLVGVTTFGKGSVQQVIPFGNRQPKEEGSGGGRSALRLTVAKYYTDSGRVIHGEGIAPDIEIERSAEQRRALLDFRHDPTSFETVPTDPQLEAALEHIEKRKAGKDSGKEVKTPYPKEDRPR